MGLYRRKGTKVWSMDFVVNNQRIRETTGMTSKVKALEVCERRKRELKEGMAGIRKRVRPLLFDIAAKKVQEAMAGTKWSPSTEEIARLAMTHLTPHFGKKLLADIDAVDIHAYQKLRHEEGAANRTVNIEVTLLRQVMKWHGQWERVKASPEWKIKGLLKERTDAGRALTAAEEKMLLLECSRSASRSLLPFVTLLLNTGARFNTIRTLTWGQVNLHGGRIVIGMDKTDAGSGRVVPLNRSAASVLEMWAARFPERQPRHFVFPTEAYGLFGAKGVFGGEVRVYDCDPDTPVGTIRKAWVSAIARTRRHCPECKSGMLKGAERPFACECGFRTNELPRALAGLRLHDLRHSAVDRMVTARVPLTTIARIVGWSRSTTVAMAARYSHADEAEMRRGVESITSIEHVPSQPSIASHIVQ